MLPEPMTELLTAFVDGELSQRERKAVMKLLQRSSAARDLLRQMQENAHKVKQLPRRKVEPSLVDEIVRAIAEQKTPPAPVVVRPARRRRWLPYVAATLAASVLIAAIGMTYWNSMGNHEDKGHQAAINPQHPKPEPVTPEPSPVVPTPTLRKQPNPLLARMTEGTFREFGQPIVADRAFTARFSELKKGGAATGQLAYELSKDRTARFDITVKDNAKAVERLKRSLFEHGIKLVVDAGAQKSLGAKKQAKAEYWIYAENVTAEEMTAMMSELGQPDTTGMGASVPTPYEKMTVTPLAKHDKETLSKKLGIAAAKLELPREKENVKPEAPKRWDRQAVVLPTGASAAPSKEVRQFAAERRQPRPGTVQVLIKIRQE